MTLAVAQVHFPTTVAYAYYYAGADRAHRTGRRGGSVLRVFVVIQATSECTHTPDVACITTNTTTAKLLLLFVVVVLQVY